MNLIPANSAPAVPGVAVMVPVPFWRTLAGRAVLAVAASLFVGVCARLSVPLPFTPVPLTLSDLAVLLVGLTLGPGTAFAALVLYLVEGASGLPVFSRGGAGGLLQLFGVTGGFLLSYPFAAATAGWLDVRLRKVLHNEFAGTLCAAAAASALLMVCGALWFGAALHLGMATTFGKATLPFLPGQLIKIFAATGIVISARRLRRAQGVLHSGEHSLGG